MIYESGLCHRVGSLSQSTDTVIEAGLYDIYYILTIIYLSVGFKVLLPTTEAQFSQSLASLRESGWVDKKSRMIFIEMTIYNIPTNLYSSVTVMFELSPSGQVLPRVNVDSAKLYRYVLQYLVIYYRYSWKLYPCSSMIKRRARYCTSSVNCHFILL